MFILIVFVVKFVSESFCANCNKYSKDLITCDSTLGCFEDQKNHNTCIKCAQITAGNDKYYIPKGEDFTCKNGSKKGQIVSQTCGGMGRYMRNNSYSLESVRKICKRSGCFFNEKQCTFEIWIFVIIMLILLLVIVLAIVIACYCLVCKKKQTGWNTLGAGTGNNVYPMVQQPYGQPNRPYGQPNQPYGQPNQPYGQPNQPYGQQQQSYVNQQPNAQQQPYAQQKPYVQGAPPQQQNWQQQQQQGAYRQNIVPMQEQQGWYGPAVQTQARQQLPQNAPLESASNI